MEDIPPAKPRPPGTPRGSAKLCYARGGNRSDALTPAATIIPRLPLESLRAAVHVEPVVADEADECLARAPGAFNRQR